MKALVLENKGVMTYRDVPTPEPAAGHVLLQVKAVSICGSDIMRYTKGHRIYDLILGHECAGVIAQVGEGVSPALIGRHAAVIPVVPCFECEQCEAGRYSACHSYSFIGSRQDGGYAEYVVLRERNALLLPDDMDLEAAALIEPSTVARHILDLGRFERGQTRHRARRRLGRPDGGAVAADPGRQPDHRDRCRGVEPGGGARAGRARGLQSRRRRREGRGEAAHR